jgi:hypothetical protein
MSVPNSRFRETKHGCPLRCRPGRVASRRWRASAGMTAPRCRPRSFARRPHGEADVCIFCKQTRHIDRAAERSISKPLAKPFPELKPVEPQRRRDERLEKLVALLRVKPRPALHRRLGQFNALHFGNLNRQTKIANQKSQICRRGAVAPTSARRVLCAEGPGGPIGWSVVRVRPLCSPPRCI